MGSLIKGLTMWVYRCISVHCPPHELTIASLCTAPHTNLPYEATTRHNALVVDLWGDRHVTSTTCDIQTLHTVGPEPMPHPNPDPCALSLQ